jgi:sulfhydrogenase subunit beta (sulfur reductase)
MAGNVCWSYGVRLNGPREPRTGVVRSGASDRGGLVTATGVIDRSGLDALIRALGDEGYTTVGPTVRDGVIVYDTIASTGDLPEGWTDEQAPGHYRLEPRNDANLFGYVVGPHSWKRFLYPARNVVWAGTRTEAGWEELPPPDVPRYAFFGARGCELAAIRIQDKVFMGDDRPVDPTYAGRREQAFIVAVDCIEPGAQCFCTSMGTGPSAGDGYDLALTELGDGRFLVAVGSAAGAEMIERISTSEPTSQDAAHRRLLLEAAEHAMDKSLDTNGLRDLLVANLEHPHWDRVADRCLGCTNCTVVCPTCFCSTMEDELTLDGATAQRTRSWDSCFTVDFAYIHGGSMRSARSARYRQWLTHKLATWVDQFDTFGCVGCGRCVTWCPVGIDLTAEVQAIRASDMRLGAPIPFLGVKR